MNGSVRSLSQARQVRDLFDLVNPGLKQVEAFLTAEMERSHPLVAEVAGWVLDSGGKRLRPALVLLVSEMLGSPGERKIRYGAVVELIHTATLLHDDIIDGSDLRRGRPTANQRFGSQAAVLVGDWLYSRAMDLCLELGDVEVMRRLTYATMRMTEGEIIADTVRGRLDVDEATYLDITRRKTAELFAAACALPALFQASTLHLTEPLLDFGLNLGMCFQLVDDLLDYEASQDELGKPAMADLREGRVTLPLILLRPRLSRGQVEQLADVAASGDFGSIEERQVLELLRTSGVMDVVRRRAEEHARKAVESAERFPAGRCRDALLRATRLLLERRS